IDLGDVGHAHCITRVALACARLEMVRVAQRRGRAPAPCQLRGADNGSVRLARRPSRLETNGFPTSKKRNGRLAHAPADSTPMRGERAMRPRGRSAGATNK